VTRADGPRRLGENVAAYSRAPLTFASASHAMGDGKAAAFRRRR
jgi:hypothetical protein